MQCKVSSVRRVVYFYSYKAINLINISAKRRTPRKSKNDSDKVREMERNTQARGLRGRPSKSPTKSPNTMSSLPKHRNLLQKPKGVVETPSKGGGVIY